VLLPLRRFDEAIAFFERLIAADPLAAPPRGFLATALLSRGFYERAADEARRLLDLHEKLLPAYITLGAVYTTRGMTQEAIAVLEKGAVLAPWYAPLLGFLAGNYRRAGEHAKAEAVLARLDAMEEHAVLDAARGLYHATSSDFDRAAECFEKVIEARHFAALSLAWSPLYEEFRQTPRGRALLAKMNLADVSHYS